MQLSTRLVRILRTIRLEDKRFVPISTVIALLEKIADIDWNAFGLELPHWADWEMGDIYSGWVYKVLTSEESVGELAASGEWKGNFKNPFLRDVEMEHSFRRELYKTNYLNIHTRNQRYQSTIEWMKQELGKSELSQWVAERISESL